MISLAEENTRLKQALDHEVENCRLAHESCLGHVRQIQSLQSQLAEAQNKVEAIVNEDNAITAETSKQLAQLHKDYELLEQERDKLQGVVNEQKTCLSFILNILIGKELSPDSTICAGNTAWISMKRWAKAGIAISPDSLPPLYTEEQICELCLCESVSLGLRQDKPYIFRVMAGCAECEKMAKENALPPDKDKPIKKFYTEDQVRPLVEAVRNAVLALNDTYSYDLKLVSNKCESALSTFQRKERG